MSTEHTTDIAIEVVDLRKSFGELDAVRGINLQIKTGEIFALLGPNGAGKTTTIEMLEGFLDPSSGEVQVLGHDPGKHDRSFKQRVGIVLQETEVELFLSVEESVQLVRSYYDAPLPLDEILAVTGLTEFRDVRPRKLSGGQKRRLDVAIGLAGNPDLLFLDEPTTGFDPHARRDAWDMLRNLRELGKTVLLTSHYMDEVEHVADRAAVMIAGQIVSVGTPQELAYEAEPRITFRADTATNFPSNLAERVSTEEDRFVIKTTDVVHTLHELTGWAIDNDVTLDDLSITQRSLEDAFVQLTQDANREAVT